MAEAAADCRTWNRRSSRGGGRRITDSPAGPVRVPECPMCQESGVAALAGEAEGGWWFVCMACDHLWDQRQLIGSVPVWDVGQDGRQRTSEASDGAGEIRPRVLHRLLRSHSYVRAALHSIGIV